MKIVTAGNVLLAAAVAGTVALFTNQAFHRALVRHHHATFGGEVIIALVLLVPVALFALWLDMRGGKPKPEPTPRRTGYYTGTRL